MAERKYFRTLSVCETCGDAFMAQACDVAKGWGRFCSRKCARDCSATLAKRFWSRVNKNGPTPEHCPELGPCWLWTGNTDHVGDARRGIIIRNWKRERASRIGWELVHGPIPDGLLVLHHCDNPLCVNAERHLFLGTHLDNMRDMAAKGRGAWKTHPERMARGERHHSAKFTAAMVKDIRTRVAAGELRSALAKEYGVKACSLGRVVSGKTWAHV